jgi:hypothetical protein
MNKLHEGILRALLQHGDLARQALIELCERRAPGASIADDLTHLEKEGLLRSYEGWIENDQLAHSDSTDAATRTNPGFYCAITEQGRKALFDKVMNDVFERHADVFKKLAE